MDLTIYMPYIYAVLAGLVYAAFGYLSKTAEADFDAKKFVSTLATSLVVVVVLLQAGQAITQASVESQMTAYFMLTVVFQKVLDWVFRKAQTLSLGTSQDTKFTAKFTGTNVAPAEVLFTDVIGNIQKWDFGDGWMATPDAGSREVKHTYNRPGTWNAAAIAGLYRSPTVAIVIAGTTPPVPPTPVIKKSWLEILIAYIMKLFGK